MLDLPTMTLLRFILRFVVLAYEKLFSPKTTAQRSPEEQERVNRELASLSLYQFEACPFCVKVRFALKRLNLPIELRDAKNNPEHKQELIEQGGDYQVPCLRIEESGKSVQWIYESDNIIRYLQERFAGP